MESARFVTCRNVITGETVEISADKLTFRPSAYGVLIKGDHILLNGFHEGWLLPGGGIEKGESLTDGLVREMKEETGLTVAVGRLLNFQQSFALPTEVPNTYFQVLAFHFLCSDPTGEITTGGFASPFEKQFLRTAEWVPLADIASLRIYNAADPDMLIRRAKEATNV